MPRYFSSASDKPRLKPGEIPFAIGVLDAPGALMAVGVAYPAGAIGGVDRDTGESLGPLEAVWRLEVGGEALDGRWVLRRGEFGELAEDAW
jgi:hypothetical protein